MGKDTADNCQTTAVARGFLGSRMLGAMGDVPGERQDRASPWAGG